MAQQNITFAVRIPWWLNAYVWSAVLAVQAAVMVGIPISEDSIAALEAHLATIICRSVRCDPT